MALRGISANGEENSEERRALERAAVVDKLRGARVGEARSEPKVRQLDAAGSRGLVVCAEDVGALDVAMRHRVRDVQVRDGRGHLRDDQLTVALHQVADGPHAVEELLRGELAHDEDAIVGLEDMQQLEHRGMAHLLPELELCLQARQLAPVPLMQLPFGHHLHGDRLELQHVLSAKLSDRRGLGLRLEDDRIEAAAKQPLDLEETVELLEMSCIDLFRNDTFEITLYIELGRALTARAAAERSWSRSRRVGRRGGC